MNSKYLLFLSLFLVSGCGGMGGTSENSDLQTSSDQAAVKMRSPASSLMNGDENDDAADDSSSMAALRVRRTAISPTTSYSTSFTSNDGSWAVDNLMPGGSINFGVTSADAPASGDQRMVSVNFPGNSSYGPGDYLSPDYAEQIRTLRSFGYGHYHAVVNPSSCASTHENVVYGIFTYWNNGSDLNGNGIVDNSEIDYEILCADPGAVYLTIWTDYTNDYHFSKVTRRLDLSTGYYSQTSPGQEKNNWDLNSEGYLTDSSGHVVSFPGFTAMDEWMDLEFTWTSGSVEYALTRNGVRTVLWNYTNAAHIPTHAAPFMMNVWRDEYNWNTGAITDYPSMNETLRADSFSYAP